MQMPVMISRTFLFLLVCTLASLKVLAIDERYAALPLSGNKIRKDSFSIVRDSVFFDNNLRPDQTTYKVRNLITFKLNEFANLKLPAAFDITVSFKVYFIRVYNGPLDSIETSLNVKYNTGSYPQKAIYTFTGGYESKVKITNVAVNQGTLSEFENSLMLENEILIQREYSFSCTNNAVTAFNTQSYLSDKGELYIAWAPQRAADEYDLEWTYIDSSAGPNYYIPNTTNYNANKVFANNATRVSITQSSYRIPLLYDSKGFLFYRVRAVQVKPNGQRIESFWSSVYSNGLGKYDFTGHERLLNWQATTSFAEEGKRKSVVQYFDGSLRNRQTVTKDNTTDTTIVAETLYDYQGRPAIQVLPTPSLSSMIKYTPNFNAPVNGAEYDKDRYDGLLADSCYCKQGAPAMGTSSGAAKYYSPNNPLVNIDYHKYIPDAKGFPFSETRYTPDNTARVSLQSGVGPEFQIDSGRAARYFYSAADQEELDVLFGTEVGNASHYFKNMVRDANGQYSISYVDMHGRTIATALAGRPLTKMDTLASAKSFTITKKLLDSNTNVIKGTSIESGKALIVTKAGNHRFQYSLLTDSISIQACQGTICYDCSYDLEITITDDCNNSTLPGGVPYVITRNNLTIDTTCNPNAAFPGVDQSVFLREGNYLVSKKLTISKKAMDDYREVFLRRNTCKTLERFIADQMLLLDIDCEPTCASCRTAIGTWETFRPNYMQQMSIPVGDTAAHREAALLAYNNMVKECDNLCYGKSIDKSIREQMLADVTAPDGQYADPNAVDGTSVLRDIGNNTLLYSTITSYIDENGNPDASPSQLPTVDQFVSAFKPSWAEALLLHHPEYPKLKRYEDFKDSHVWDEKFGRTESFKAAVDSGYLNPANFSNLPSNPIYTHYPQRADPFFTSLATNKKAAMQDSLLNKVKLPNNATTSAWAIATVMAHCPGGDDNCRIAYSSNDLAYSMDTACSGELDIAWRYFRELYLQEKREIIDRLLTEYATTLGKTPEYYNTLASAHTLNFVSADAGALINISQNPGEALTQANNDLQTFINDNCKAYAIQWWEQLKPCGFSQNDSAAIIDRLIQVCREGGDSSHVFGASTVKPSSTNLDRSFEQVVKAYAGSNYNTTCNVFLLTAPLPYDKQPIYYNKPVFQKPDSCECTTINNLYQQYQLAGRDASFSAYIYRTTRTSIHDGVLDTLRKACNGEIDCQFLKSPLSLPPVLQCGGGQDVCVSCTGVSTLYTTFKQQFPGVVPSYDDIDSTQRAYNALFEKFMNVNLGFGKKTAEYLDFIAACGVSDDYCNVALAFNGTTGKKRITIPVRNNRLNLGTGDFTFEARIKPKSNSPFNQILSNRTYSSGPLGNGFSFLIQNTGQLLIQMEGCYNYQSINSGGVDVFDGKPHHVAVSRQGDSLGLYIDGIKLSYAVLCDIGTTKPPSQRNITTSGPWYIGMDTTGAAPYPLTGFNGWIDEVRVWNVARSGADIANNLNTTLSAQPNLVGYYLLRSKDTCEQSIVDLSTPDTTLRNNGYLGYSPAKDMTEPSWLSAAQISYTAADPVGVPNACGCGGVAPVTPACDSLNLLKQGFNTWYEGLTSYNCTNSKWHYYHAFSFTEVMPFCNTVSNGIVRLPDTYTTKHQAAVDVRDTICAGNSFTAEFRIRMPQNSVRNYAPNYSVHVGLLYDEVPGSYNKLISCVFHQPNPSAAPAMVLHNVQYSAPNFVIDFQEFRVVKIKKEGDLYSVYVDDTLRMTKTDSYVVPRILRMSVLFSGIGGEYDWIKFYDSTGTLKYFEDFEDFEDTTHFTQPDRSILCSPPPTCESAFTTYYNQLKGTNYTFSQIDSIYYNRCGKRLDACQIPAENSSCTFQKTYGGSGTDMISDVKQTSDKSYVMAGRTNSFGNGNLDAYVVKTDKEGNLLWSRTYGGTNEDYFSRIRPTTDGGYIAVGTTRSYNQSQGEIFVVKMNQAGDVTWSRAFGRGTAGGDIGTNIIQTSDGGYVIAGNTNYVPTHSDGILIRLNSAGNIIWTRRLGSNNSDDHCAILQDNDTLIAVMAHFSNAITGIPSTNYNGLVTKLNMSNGHVFWAKSYDVNSPNSIRIMDVYPINGGYKIAALGTVGWGSDNVRTLSFNITRNGDITQVRRLQAPRDTVVGYASIYPTSDGGFIASQGEFNSSADVYWHKTNAAGTIEWSNVVKRAGDQRLAKVLQNYDGSYAGAGYHNGDALLMKVTAAGKAGCGDSSVNYSNDTVPWFVYPVPLPLDNYDSVIFSNPNITVTAQNAGTIVTSLCNNCGLSAGITLCGRSEPVFPPVALNQHSPCDDSTLFAVSKGTLLYEAYRDSLMNSFDDRYLAKCLNARYNESFTVEQPISEYHYTLYYYDQAGNLVKTIPPQGVDLSKFAWAAGYSDSVKIARRNRQMLRPEHTLPTQYRYNSLNQPVAQQSPDGGISNFWYDRLGRLAASQNAKQKAAGSSNDQDRQYSYTHYDNIGRITEVGQIKNTSANGAMTDAVSRNAASLGTWLSNLNSRREQITQTIYDLPYNGFIGAPDPRTVIAQRNIRNRVSYVSYTEHNNPVAYNQATFYTYDIMGNTDTLLQDYGCGDCGVVASYNMMNRTGNARKKFAYQYDLISGKVNMMLYQNGWSDMWLHRYTYDAENRLILTETSNDSLVWEKDARYEYYKHGPLARMVIGEQLVQGLDYAYTLQGWLKGVNSTGATSTHDIGADGKAGSLNQYVARDALGFNLNYFHGDYKAINAGITSFPSYRTATGLPDSVYRPLYNGNISSMATHLRMFDAQGHVPIFYNYKYDQLNRFVKQDAFFFSFNASTNSYGNNWAPDSTFHEQVGYDANGNIQYYNRYAIGPQSKMDGLTYKYYPGTNKLRQVNDHIVANKYGSNSWEVIQDLDNQSADSNYVYDEIGNLIKDSAEKITNIKWNVYGKIAEITRSAIASDKVNTTRIQYTYDAQGNRISKVTEKAGTTVKEFTWYVRDAQGNLITTYKASGSVNETTLQNLTNISLDEQMIYGSSRLGMYAFGNGVFGGPNSRQFYSSSYFDRGRRQYELTNHLGNVLTTISDKKTGISSGGIGAAIDYYEPDMVSASDYYPFGMVSRVATATTGKNYRFGFNGKENDSDVKGWANQQDYGMRIYDNRLGRFLSVDPITKDYPELTPYQYASNRPVTSIDIDGLEAEELEEVAAIPQIDRGLRVVPKSGPPAKIIRLNPKINAPSPGIGRKILRGAMWLGARLGGTIAGVLLPLPAYGPTPTVSFETHPNNDPQPLPDPEIDNEDDGEEKKRPQKFWVTYTKTKYNEDGTVANVYSGRSSGYFVGEQPTLAEIQGALDRRDKNHKILQGEGYEAAELDKVAWQNRQPSAGKNARRASYQAIRGREQDLIDMHGGAKKDGGTARNKIRGYSRKNKNASQYKYESGFYYGNLPNNNPTDKNKNP